MNLDEAFAAGVRAERAGRWEEAETLYRNAISQGPTNPAANYGLGTTLLSQGRYAEAWPYYEARHYIPEFNNPLPPLPWPRWKGEPIAGKTLLIWLEQGLGDQIMFSRFVRDVVDAGGHPVLFTAPPLASLLSALPCEVRALTETVELSPPSYWTMIGALPRYLGVTPQSLSGAPYLTVPGETTGGVGVKVRGAPGNSEGLFRTLPAGLGERLLAMPNTVSLEPEDSGAGDFLATARIVQGLDSVLTVDTSVAHLAGALGKRTILMLPPSGADWRWNHAPARWYDSVEVVRGETWEDVASKAMDALRLTGAN